ncbi:MAG TPA: NYN domain-containing protein [Terriglobales bacterium]|nr:NYN domain-containing protein [Terriglobales bacterium]
MAYLIDGNNLLGRVAPEELRQRSGRDTLVVKLLAFQKVTRTRIHLVFDGNPERERSEVPVNPKFTILYPGEGQTADDVIEDVVRRLTDRRRFFVVSSDRAVREFAKENGVAAVTSEEFAKDLKAALKERKKQKELEKHVRNPSPLEVDLWGEVFKVKP